MGKLLVIVVTFNGIRWIEKCLSSVINSTIKADLFIVDNGSTDGSINFIQNNFPEAHLVISSDNLGFGRANNIGIRHAIDNNYDFVYLLNQDAWVERFTFEILIGLFNNNKEYGIISPLQINAAMDKLDNNFSMICPRELVSDAVIGNELKTIYKVNFVMAAHWLISRRCLETVGGFSTSFPHYGEDNNYIQRATFHGFNIGISPLTKGVHDREYRKQSTEHLQYLRYIHIIERFNNPLENRRVLKVIKDLLISRIGSNKITYRNLWNFIKNISQMNCNFRISKKAGPNFL